jgi:hypothetical protein
MKRLAAASCRGTAQHGSNAGTVFPDHRQDGTGLDDDFKQLAALVVELEQFPGQDQVAGGGDGQKFGQPLDNAENGCLEQKQGVHDVIDDVGGLVRMRKILRQHSRHG